MKPKIYVPILCGGLSLLLSVVAPEFYLRKNEINFILPINTSEIGQFIDIAASGLALVGIVIGFILRKYFHQNLMVKIGIIVSLIALLFNLLCLPI